MSDNTVYLQTHKLLDMSLIKNKMRLLQFPVHGLKVLSGVCCLAALSSVTLIGFYVIQVGNYCWSELLAPFAILRVEVHKLFCQCC